ncbi:hypothetical protein DNTS_016604 [Danionella cerebrum]|uniref:RZ-type domain-containing protein n=1 Tax=Danionella cerebrum TaxID=2873325 RepID=A0A553R5F7_9TELE|nr:hypothetical protein DNTS_016604 [Danionella translucida]
MMSNPKGGKQRGRGVSVPARNRGRGRGGGDGSQQQAGRSAISQRERGLDDDVQGAVGGGRGQGLRHGSWSGFHRPVMRGGANSSSPFQGRTGISAAHSIPSLLRLGNLNETPGRPSIFKGNCRGKMDALRVQGGYGIGRARVDASRSMADLRPSPRGGGNRRGKTGSQSHGRSRGGARDGPREIHKIGYKTLEGLLEKDASEVAISLSSSTGLRLLLEESEIRNDLVQLLCKVLCKAFQSRIDRSTVMHLAQIIKDSKFFRHGLPYHVTGMMSEFANAQREQYPQHLNNILNLLSSVLNIFPRSSIQSVSMVVALLKTTVHQLRASGVDILENTDQELERLQSLVDQLQEKSREGTLRSDDYSCHAANEDTPPGEQDFREISIYPIYEEFHENRRPFLRPNRITQSFPNAHIYLDTHFRLLREDFVRPLRDGVKEILSMVHEENLNENQIQKKHFDDVRIYNDTHLLLPVCTPTGIAYRVTFDARQLQFVRWENSKRLIYGSLVCLSMDKFETFLFATVADRDPELLRKGEVNLCFSLNSREQLASIRPSDSFLMVETTAYFEAYRYVLEGLQELSQDEFPFQRYIVQCVTAVDPPAYLRVEGRTYDLSPVAPKGQSIPRFNPLTPQAWPDEEKLGLDESQLQAFKLALTNELAIIQGPPGTGKTFVGLKIARALLENREAWSQDCPMLVVCYTNHALDQFLEGIYRFLRWGIVRVGGRSNSEILKPFNLRELTRGRDFHHNLPMHLRRAFEDVKKEMQNSKERLEEHSIKSECSLGGIIREEILRSYMDEEHWNSLRAGLYEPKQKTTVIAEWLGVSFSAFKSFPSTEEKAAADEATSQAEEAGLIRVEEEAELIQAERMLQEVSFPWKKERSKQEEEKLKRDAVVKAMVVLTLSDDESCNQTIQKNQKKKLKKTVKEELKKTSCMSEVQEKHLTDLWGLSMKDRWSLYRLWVFRYRCDLRNKALTYEQEYQRAADRLSEVRQHEDLSVLREARVVGMTTTGAAKYRQVLQELRPRLVIIEEAAEVLEAHTITTLSQACQHLILIGDHQQLRPSATVYDLAKNYNLEVSMFERLVKMDFPFVRLNYQHRMRPSIARLLTPHIYKSLENHPSVLEYENVKGVLGNVFFVDHSHFEDEIQDGRTRKNTHEAHFVVKLCRYLLLQEYKPSQITILTTYTGQLHCLRKLMPFSEFSDVKVHVVDKYQGEENDIIILSLVRSNSENRVGFLNIPNRVCVALSRAKMGLYCIGNMGMLSSVPLWSNILQTLREQGQFRLECGHVCTRMCHPYDADHKKFMCLKECPKVLCELEHKCPLRCYETCKKCRVPVDKIIPSCQHHQKVPCHQEPKDFKCQVQVPTELKCGHMQEEPCYDSRDPTVNPRCLTKCGFTLKCGHSCPGTCHGCKQGCLHKACTHKCKRILVCSHQCREPCVRDCPPCSLPCQNRCVHSKCEKTCGQPCAPCREPCIWQCPHHSCTKLCHEPCDRPPCSVSCPKYLPCGHPCIGLCGETCPDKCRICHKDKVTEIFFGNEDEPDACFIQLEDCQHLFEISGMDRYISQDEDQDAELDQRAIRLKECPRCRTPIRRNLRYGTHINRSLAAIEMVKEKISGVAEINKQKQKELNLQLRKQDKLRRHFHKEFEFIQEELKTRKLSLQQLWHYENLMSFLERIGKLKSTENDYLPSPKVECLPFTQKMNNAFKFVTDQGQRFSEQQISDLESELSRLSYLADLNQRSRIRRPEVVSEIEVQQLRAILEDDLPFSEAREQRVKQIFTELDVKLPRIGLGITDQERVSIVKAMGLNKGHWYKCPNGHVYAIGDCGGAMVKTKCPECDSAIGGTNHSLTEGNAVATEMDGAQHPAWSDAANMANFDLRDFYD